jgi:hypothetical protein
MRALLLSSTAALALGCAPTFAPPIRSTHYGAPARVAPGEVEISGAGSAYLTAGVYAGLPIAEDVQLELGSDFASPDQEGGWRLSVGGLRYTHAPKVRERGFGGAFDIEGGLGFGAGGVNSEVSNADAGKTAFGGYFGMGAGLHFSPHVALFARGRAQLSTATNVPTTFWGSGVFGPEITFGPASFYLATGIAGYSNDLDQIAGLVMEGGLSFHFGAPPDKAGSGESGSGSETNKQGRGVGGARALVEQP